MSTKQPKAQFLLLPILLLGFALRICRLDHQSLWWDELSTIARAGLPLPELFNNLLHVRNHMPLYFLLVRPWADLGTDAFEMRFFSVIWAMVGIALIFSLGRLISGRRVGSLAAFLLAISPFHIWYSQETRMYAMLATLSLAAHWFLLKAIAHDRKRYWIGYLAAMFMAIYTHFLALFLLITHYVFFSIHYRRLKPQFGHWLIAAGSLVLLTGIWAGVIMSTGGFADAPIGWIAPARFYEPVLTFLVFSVGPTIDPSRPTFYPAFLVCLGSIAVAIKRFAWGSDTRLRPVVLTARLLLLWLLLPILLLYLISLEWGVANQRSIYMDRYLIISLPAFILLVAWGMIEATKRANRYWLMSIGLVTIAVTSTMALANGYFNPGYAREDWRAAIKQLSVEWQAGDILLLDPGQVLPVGYYGSGRFDYEIVPFLPDEPEKERYLSQEMPSRLAAVQTKTMRLWHVAVAENTNPHGFPRVRNQQVAAGYLHDPYAAWLDRHYPVAAQFQFTGLRLTRYDLSMKLTP
jgi:mannosyltransferase